MATYFDEKKWRVLVTQKPGWHLTLAPELKKLWKKREKVDEDEAAQIKEEVYGFFEKHLTTGQVVLGTKGEDFDAERGPIDTVLIHHTKNEPGLPLPRLNAIHFTNLYIPEYAATDKEESYRGTPIWSGHMRNGNQVFYAYHWLVRMDGTQERLLQDNEIGWQAGNWEVNKRSVAICFDNDYTQSEPTKEVLSAAADIMRTHYPGVSTERIIGHREVNPKTECPGNTFLDGWKHDLHGLLS